MPYWRVNLKGADMKCEDVDNDILCNSLPGIDIASGLYRLNNNRVFYVEMLTRFLNTKRNYAGEIKARLEEHDRETANRLAHSMKSIAGGIGANDLMASAAALETDIETGGDAGLALADFEEKLNKVIIGLEAAFQGNRKNESPVVSTQHSYDPSEVSALITEISELLEQDTGRAFVLVDALKEKLAGTALQGELNGLVRALEVFDFDAARMAMRTVAERL